MTTAVASVYRPSTYAAAVISRGMDVAMGQIDRLRETIGLAREAVAPGSPARVALDVDTRLDACCDEGLARTLDRLTDAVVRAQRLVSHESRASAILFLDREKRKEWASYGEYRRSWDAYLACVVGR